MSEANFDAEKYKSMNPWELERELARAKALLPRADILNGIARWDNSSLLADRWNNCLEIISRRKESESCEMGRAILCGVGPRMVVTDHLQRSMVEQYNIAFQFGVTEKRRDWHLLQILFPEAVFPNLDLSGALFDRERAARIELAIYRDRLKFDEYNRTLLTEALGPSRESPDILYQEQAEWVAQMRSLHGTDVIS